MNKTFKAKVNDVHEYEITNKNLSDLDALQVSDSEYHILRNNKPYHAEIINSDFGGKLYSVKINNTTHAVRIANALDNLIDSMGFAVSASKIINKIKAPMPGLILDINIEVGQAVKEN